MAERKKCDIAVIGSGPGGYVAAIKATQMGKSVALIEKNLLGGCCLNVGCIPTKTLLANASILHSIRRAADFGIKTGPISFHYDQMKARKDSVITKIRTSLEGLIKSNKITICRGAAEFESPYVLKIAGQDNLFLEAGKIIIATGSIPLDIKAFPCDHDRILNSTSLLELTEAPKSLAIVGGGYIGCEFASLFAELGCKVTILEALPTILAAQGASIAQFMTKALTSRGIEIKTNVKVKSIENKKSHALISLEDGQTLEADFALVSVGRKVYTDGLKLEKAGLKTTEKGFIATDDKMQTDVRGIYAIGDVTGKWMLAHVASHQGVIAASNAAGVEAKMHYEAVPAVVFTSPEIATVGLTLEQAKEKGYDAALGSFPFQALGKAQASMDTEGYTQIVSDRKTKQILGASAIGHEAGNLIAEMALAIQNELTLESVADTIHAHPTLAESWLEAALIANEMPIHFPPKIKR
ncbi:MAG: dihydrolipoyl dehydrogenase [Chlamydiae bacterium RIFCSPHIGHO2_12_FULL_49_9]|nr:MAG: dihydrolipoyl dehydrogenase [Chlamydiae bacterium RIFCSPHIGHO2_12_FULL_49_9]